MHGILRAASLYLLVLRDMEGGRLTCPGHLPLCYTCPQSEALNKSSKQQHEDSSQDPANKHSGNELCASRIPIPRKDL
jgi:hypothetical protein